jgi:hypothetical protein
MSLESETKLLEFAKWFNFHKSTITSLDKRCEFLEKAVDNLAVALLHAIEDIKVLEGRGRIGGSLEVISPHNALQKVQARMGGKPLDLKQIKNG